MCRLGATDADIAEFLGVEISRVGTWAAIYPEFAQALKLGKELADDAMERSLYQKGRGFYVETEKIFCNDGVITRARSREYHPPDTAAAFIWLKNRRRDEWRDRHEIAHSGKVEHKFSLSVFDGQREIMDEQRAADRRVLELAAEKTLEPAINGGMPRLNGNGYDR
jgi:hypothetical protein